MKTANGKYIAPQPIENSLSDNNFIDHAMLVAEGKPYVTAVIIPNFEALKLQLEKMKIPFTSWDQMVESAEVKEFYRLKIDEIQKNRDGFEKVKKFILMPTEFEINSGEITPTLKVKRKVVLSKYADVIEKMYSH
jgi:long-chain acyl-CoA synthetase